MVAIARRRRIRGKLVACDTETTGISVWRGAAPFAFSFCNDEGETYYVEFPVDPKTRRVMYEKRPKDFAWLKEFFGDKTVVKVFHHAKFDVRMISYWVGPVKGKIEETMFAAHCCNSGEMNLKLKDLANRYADFPKDDEKALQRAVNRLRRRAKSLGWKIADKHDAKKPTACDYWLPMYAEKLLPGDPIASELRKTCETYAVGDAERTMLLWLFYKEKMEELDVVGTYKAEMRLWPVTYAMEERGVYVDRTKAKELLERFRIEKEKYLNETMAVGRAAIKAGVLKVPGNTGGFNPRSHPQLSCVLYDFLKLAPPRGPRGKKKRTARPTDADTMLELSVQHELPNSILRMRSAAKGVEFMESYIAKMVRYNKWWFIHADFNQVGPRTGRYSCRDPNLQQAASENTGRSSNPIDVRAPFGPRPGCVWYTIDFSQLEVRIFADLAKESNMLRIIKSGQHIHKACANHVWGGFGEPAIAAAEKALHLDRDGTGIEANIVAVWKHYAGTTDLGRARQRSEKIARKWLEEFEGDIVAAEESINKKNTVNKAKLAIFTRLFGGGIPSIMNLMKCSRDEAQKFLREYAEAFDEMEPWMRRVTRDARREGNVRTAFDRMITVDPEVAYRAVNYCVQGSAADLMKRALVKCASYIKEEKLRAWIVMTIHDEIVFEFERGQERMEHVRNIKSIMEDHGGAFSIPMPTKVECVTKSWTHKKEVKWAA